LPVRRGAARKTPELAELPTATCMISFESRVAKAGR
jgi:hypothetical protein